MWTITDEFADWVTDVLICAEGWEYSHLLGRSIPDSRRKGVLRFFNPVLGI